MIRDYDNITPEQEAGETVVFGEWFDWFFDKQGIDQSTEIELEIGKRSISQYKDMLMDHFPLQESTLSYLPGVAEATDREGFLEFIKRVMNGFAKMGYLQ